MTTIHDARSFMKVYDNGAGWSERKGDGRVSTKEVARAGGASQMASDYMALPDAEKIKVRAMLDRSPINLARYSLAQTEMFRALALKDTLPTSGPPFDPRLEAAAMKSWSDTVMSKFNATGASLKATPIIITGWAVNVELALRPFFENQDGTLNSDAARVAVRKLCDSLEKKFPTFSLIDIGGEAFTVRAGTRGF